MILVARTAPGEQPLVEKKAKEVIRRRIGGKPTPAQVEEHLRPLRAAEEARQTVEALRLLGAKVVVKSLDLSVELAVTGLLRDILGTFGRLDVVIHGAGMEESRQLKDKTDADFQRIYGPKAQGGLWLAEGLPAGTCFVSMGSIAGLFGNAGQTDYAAANAAMAAVCVARPWSLHLSWTAWGGTGMAVRGGMESLLTGRGVELLPPRAGAVLVADMVAAGCCGEVMVAGRIGDFGMPPWHSLLDHLSLEGDAAVGRKRLDIRSAPWLEDHAREGVPLLPGVIGLEMMVATALGAWPRGTFLGAEDVRFLAPIKLHREEPVDIIVQAEPLEEGRFRCLLRSRRKTRGGKIIETDNFEATVLLEEIPLLAPLAGGWIPGEDIVKEEIYRRFFHGPRFQVLQSVEAMAVKGLVAAASADPSGLPEGLVTAPLVLEAAFQAAGLHWMLLRNRMALPASMEAMALVRTPAAEAALEVTVRLRGEGDVCCYDIDVEDEIGTVLKVRGFRLSEIGALPKESGFDLPPEGWPSVGEATAAEAEAEDSEQFGARGTLRRRQDRVAGQRAACRAVGAIHPGRFLVLRDALGAPVVRPISVEASAKALSVSISHRGVEVRDPAFVRDWFGPGEGWAGAGDPESISAGWAIKEAVLKAMGTGMRISPREIAVRTLHPPHIELHGEAAKRLQEIGGRLGVIWGSWRGKVVALARIR